MEVARAWEEKGVRIPPPYSRTIKMIFAPDRRNVEEASFSLALIDPGSQTDYHAHDRPELIYRKSCAIRARIAQALEKWSFVNSGRDN